VAKRATRSARTAESNAVEFESTAEPIGEQKFTGPRIKKPGQGELIPFLTIEEVAVQTMPIKVFGNFYDMVAPQDMSPLDRHKVDSMWQRMLEIQGAIDGGLEITATMKVEMEGAVNSICRMIIPTMPGTVFNRLNWVQKEAIVEGFLAWRAQNRSAAEMAAELEAETGRSLLIGEISSPDSRPATTRRTRSSGRPSRPTS